MSEVNLSEKFPEMRPITSAPSLSTINGIGTTLVGSRDYDHETSTYVKTHAFCIVFIPVLAIGAYRVADAQRGWYFLGKVPLSRLAKGWNCALLALILGLVGRFFWTAHTHSPDYVAGQQMSEADRLAAAGQQGKAAAVYRDVLAGGSGQAATARTKLVQLLDSPPESAEEAGGILQVAVAWQREGKPPLVPNLFERGMDLARKNVEQNPRGALAVLDAIAPIAPDADACNAQRRALLERLVVQEPADADVASRLAVLYETGGDTAKCETLLAPHAAKLGLLEGARILGRLYAAQGKHEAAYAVLKPYADGRLAKLHAAEQGYQSTVQAAEDRVIAELRGGHAPGFAYARFKTANDTVKQGMVREYVGARLKDDPSIKSVQQQLMQEAAVVPVALDLGIVMLYRAQGLPDPAARRKELEQAEQTFLAIRGLAGETDKYRLYLGQVYFWLGKQGEGRKLFDELLKAKNRSSDILLETAQVYREVGAVTDARTLLEEAYNKETDKEKKQGAALFRSLLFTDLDDEISWLSKANQEEPSVRASLSSARGNKALRDGKDDEAAGHLRQAIDTYQKMPENAATLNNGALAYLSLFHVTREREHFTKGLDMLDKAVALKPSDTILLYNAASTVLQSAVEDLIGEALDLKILKRQAGLELLGYLGADDAAKQKNVERVRKHVGMAKARGYLEKLMVLSPKRPASYHLLTELFEYTHDMAGLKNVRQQLEKADLDQADANRETLDFFAGKNIDKHLNDLKTALTRQEASLPAARKKGGATRAVAAASLARLLMSMASVQPVDAERIVALAEEAHAAAPSDVTYSLRTSAWCFRAHQALVKQEPTYAELAAQTQRSFSAVYLIAIALGRPGPLRDKAVANADVARALKGSIEYGGRFPDARGVWHWALLRGTQPDEAAVIAKSVNRDAFRELEIGIEVQLSPLSGTSALHACWLRQLNGQEAEAAEVLKQFAGRGVPLPAGIR